MLSCGTCSFTGPANSDPVDLGADTQEQISTKAFLRFCALVEHTYSFLLVSVWANFQYNSIKPLHYCHNVPR